MLAHTDTGTVSFGNMIRIIVSMLLDRKSGDPGDCTGKYMFLESLLIETLSGLPFRVDDFDKAKL